jgi:hypothetical protein
LLSYERLSKKPLLFKSFTGLPIQDFDNVYNKEIVKEYEKHEISDYLKVKMVKRENERLELEDHSN